MVATGFDVIPLDKYDEYAYSQSKDVITSLELERIMNAAGPTKGHLERLSDGKAPKTLYLYSVWEAVALMKEERATAPRSAVCTLQNMQC